MNLPTLALWLLAIALMLHVLEEVWVTEYLKGQVTWGEVISNYAPIVENIPIFIFAIVLPLIGWRSPLLIGILPAVSLTHPLLDHINLSVKYRRFRPGSFTAIFLMMPLSLWLYDLGTTDNLFRTYQLIISGVIGLGISIWLWREVEKDQKKSPKI